MSSDDTPCAGRGAAEPPVMPVPGTLIREIRAALRQGKAGACK